MITVNLYYTGKDGSAKAFADEFEAKKLLIFRTKTNSLLWRK